MDRKLRHRAEKHQTNTARPVCLETCSTSVAFSDKMIRIRRLGKVPETELWGDACLLKLPLYLEGGPIIRIAPTLLLPHLNLGSAQGSRRR